MWHQNMLFNCFYDIKISLTETLTILWKQMFSWLNPHLERFTPSTKPNPHLSFWKYPTPTYRVVLEKSSTPPPPSGWGVETMYEVLTSLFTLKIAQILTPWQCLVNIVLMITLLNVKLCRAKGSTSEVSILPLF